MAGEEAVGGAQLLRRSKIKLIDALSADPDFVLQHADSLCLLSPREYQQVKALTVPCDKVRDLLDNVIRKGTVSAEKLLLLLRGDIMQETFPTLVFLKKLPLDNQQATEDTIKRRHTVESKEDVPAKQYKNGSKMVTEKQLMLVARNIGRSWREIGRLALEIPSVKLEQFEEDHPNNHVEQVFAMLRYWCTRQRQDATAACLHSLLCQDQWALPPESIDFLLDTS